MNKLLIGISLFILIVGGISAKYYYDSMRREELGSDDQETPDERLAKSIYPHQLMAQDDDNLENGIMSAISKNKRSNPYKLQSPGDPGHDLQGRSLESNYCRDGLGQIGIVEGENELYHSQVYTVQPSSVNLKFFNAQM